MNSGMLGLPLASLPAPSGEGREASLFTGGGLGLLALITSLLMSCVVSSSADR